MKISHSKYIVIFPYVVVPRATGAHRGVYTAALLGNLFHLETGILANLRPLNGHILSVRFFMVLSHGGGGQE